LVNSRKNDHDAGDWPAMFWVTFHAQPLGARFVESVEYSGTLKLPPLFSVTETPASSTTWESVMSVRVTEGVNVSDPYSGEPEPSVYVPVSVTSVSATGCSLVSGR
jgi:hypothetical protein